MGFLRKSIIDSVIFANFTKFTFDLSILSKRNIMSKNKLQQEFLLKIKETMPENVSFIDEIAETLEISNDSAYRRLRGETALTINEVSKLCTTYNISFDMFTQNNENISFTYSTLHNANEFVQYLQAILSDMKQIEKSDNNKIIYAAVDIPIFHHFNFPELSAFKMYYWMKAVVGVEEFNNKKFSTEIINEDIANIGKEIYKTYTNIPSIEIWTTETINSLIKQIEFFWESGNFLTNKDALVICKQAKQEIVLLEKQAEVSNKLMDDISCEKSKFTLYYSDIEIGNNCIYTQRADLKSVYLSVHTFNKLLTVNQKFVIQTEAWLDNLISKSILISGVAEKNRYQFFKKANDKIDKLIKRISEE